MSAIASESAAITKGNNKRHFDSSLCDSPELIELSPYLHHVAPLSTRPSVRVTRELRNDSALGWRNLRRCNHVCLFVLPSQFKRNREGDHTKAFRGRSWIRRRCRFIQSISRLLVGWRRNGLELGMMRLHGLPRSIFYTCPITS